jgi:hypothetical protein
VSTQLPPVGGQVDRFGGLSILGDLAVSSNVAKLLSDEATSFTLFAPSDPAFADGDDPVGALGATPTQAFDYREDGPSEDTTSTVRADILKYHAVQGDSLSEENLPATVETMLGNTEVTVTEDMVKQADIPASNGVVHRLNTLLLPPTASVDFTDRTVQAEDVEQGSTVVVDGSYIPEGGGFIVLHDESQLDGTTAGAVASTVGVSDYIEGPVVANKVEITLDEDLTDDITLGAMAHEDTNDNESYDFPSSGGAEDGPYTIDTDGDGNEEPVIDFAAFTVESN